MASGYGAYEETPYEFSFATPTPSSTPIASAGGHLGIGPVAGIVVGTLLGVSFLAAALAAAIRRAKRRRTLMKTLPIPSHSSTPRTSAITVAVVPAAHQTNIQTEK